MMTTKLKKRRLSFEILDEGAIPERDEGSENEDISDRIEEIREAIIRLPDGFRVVLTLYLLEGYDHEEIGQILDINPSTSRSQFTRARQKLVEMLKNRNHE